jgi:hypothetical protein
MKDSYFVILADEAYQQQVEELKQNKRLKEEPVHSGNLFYHCLTRYRHLP